MKTPWHSWGVGIVSLLWNAGGAYDYLMTKMQNADYLAVFMPEQLAYFTSLPLWVNICWGLGVWGAVAGSLLLLARSRFAGTAFALSLLGMLGNLIYGFLLSETTPMDIAGPMGVAFTIVIVVVGLLLWIYARRMTRAGVLR